LLEGARIACQQDEESALTEPLPIFSAKLLWIVFFVYWVVSARKLKPVKQRETTPERLQHLLPLAVAYILLLTTGPDFGWLSKRFVPNALALNIFAVGLSAVGVAFAIWARWHLGSNWSGVVTLKEGHELIRTGPYRSIRHPIYTGMLLAVIGTALALGEARGILSFLIILAAFYQKARREESFLSEEFGANFMEHCKHTGMFLPHLS
jgi:protein-S-isoprenylcysteine O-methyltransferase Ste14